MAPLPLSLLLLLALAGAARAAGSHGRHPGGTGAPARHFARDGESPVFVVGTGHSGTTVFRVILDQHPRLCCGPESGVFLRGPPYRPHSTKMLAAFTDGSEARLRELVRQSNGDFALFADSVFSDYCAAHGKARWAEKTPSHFRHVPGIFDNFPNATVVVMARDPRDVVLSRMHRYLDRGAYASERAATREAAFARALDSVASSYDAFLSSGFAHDRRVVNILYEDFAMDPEGVLRQFFATIGEAWDASVLQYYKRAPTSHAAGALPGHKMSSHEKRRMQDVRKPVHSSSIGIWRAKDGLHASEVTKIETRCRNVFEHHGYVLSTAIAGDGPTWNRSR